MGNTNSKSVKFNGQTLNLTDISRSIDISVAHISRILNGKRQASPHVQGNLQVALGISPGEFLTALSAKLHHDRLALVKFTANTADFRAASKLPNQSRLAASNFINRH